METLTCGECGIAFGVPEHWVNARRVDCKKFYCPNGHCRVFLKSANDILREENEQLKRDKEQAALGFQAELNEKQHLLLVAQKHAESERRKRRRIEARVSKGVCPCCNRTFENVQKHMETKHRGYGLPPATPKQITGVVQ